MSVVEEHVKRLESLGKSRARLLRQLGDVERELLDEAIPDAYRAGVPKRRIATAAGVVRQTVYNTLRRLEG